MKQHPAGDARRVCLVELVQTKPNVVCVLVLHEIRRRCIKYPSCKGNPAFRAENSSVLMGECCNSRIVFVSTQPRSRGRRVSSPIPRTSVCRPNACHDACHDVIARVTFVIPEASMSGSCTTCEVDALQLLLLCMCRKYAATRPDERTKQTGCLH